MEFPKLEEFFIELQRGWEKAIKSIEIAKEVMKRQFDKKRQNPQELKIGDNMWLEAKNIYSNWPEKIQTLYNLKRYWLRSISVGISKIMDDTQCVQWRPVNIMQGTTVQGSAHGTSTTTRHCQWERRVWSGRN